jgi:putative hydrolase of the HAD superfamily
MSGGITTVLFDADGVVQTTPADWLDALAALCGIPGSRDAFLDDVFAAEKPALTGQADFRPALADVLERWRSSASLDEAIRVWHRIQPQESVLERVAQLRDSGLRVSLATNQQAERAAHMTGPLGYASVFDDLFFSCEMGHAKPDRRYFAAVLERLAQPGSTVLFVDDHPLNVEAARTAGLQASVYDLRTGVKGLNALLADHGLIQAS